MSKNSSEPAYPIVAEGKIFGGLTKREVFAMHAMQALVNAHPNHSESLIAIEAIQIADRLIQCLGDSKK